MTKNIHIVDKFIQNTTYLYKAFFIFSERRVLLMCLLCNCEKMSILSKMKKETKLNSNLNIKIDDVYHTPQQTRLI